MNTETKITPEEKARKTLELREYHRVTLDAIDHDVMYRPRRFFVPTKQGKTTPHVIFFPSELKQGKDIYTEMINDMYDSEDATRTLYKWPFSANWDEVYTKVVKGQTTYYLIPVTDLKVVEKAPEGIDEQAMELVDPEQDSPMDQMTIRDYYAIHKNKPVSHKKWLNQLINKNK